MRQRFQIAVNPTGILLLLLCSLACTGCVAPMGQPASALEAATPLNTLSRLYFGRSTAGGGHVSEHEWNTFLAEVVTPRFPGGFTTWPAQGQWRERSGAIAREGTFVLEIVHGINALDAVNVIVNEYKRRFRQESVLWIRERVESSF